jgi:BirA family transcriptional regulator, biotin operon repressor / biotin---[acetyl-CoA-carboxylase] ligase
VSDTPPVRASKPSTTLGHPRVHLRRADSTNERARELAIAGAPHGTLVTASEQTAGRGRQGRRWSAPAGSSLLMSLVLRGAPPLLPLIAAVATCDVSGERAQIKWPNDIVVEADAGRGGGSAGGALAKLAGILIEARLAEDWAVLGIGLNVAVRLDELPPELRPRAPGEAPASSGLPAATLGLAPADVESTLARLIGELERRLAEPSEATLQAWRARDALRGREIAWAGGRGRAEGIDGTGRLMVALADGGRTALGAGEVHLRAIA